MGNENSYIFNCFTGNVMMLHNKQYSKIDNPTPDRKGIITKEDENMFKSLTMLPKMIQICLKVKDDTKDDWNMFRVGIQNRWW